MAFYEENPSGVSKADMVVAVPSYDEAGGLGRIVERASLGLTNFFGGMGPVLINCDNASPDGTKDVFFSAPCQVPRIYLSTPADARGKGANLRNLFEKVRELDAKIVVVIEADIRNFEPHWVKTLAEPLTKGMGYVSPLYVRHKYESTLTYTLLYPLTRCLYGRRVRQPMGGDCGFSGALADRFLASPVWNEDVERAGIDIFMTTVALTARVPVCQAFMGGPKLHRTADPFTEDPSSFREVVTTLLDLMIANADFWRQVKWSKPTALAGAGPADMDAPPAVEVNQERLHAAFLQGFTDYEALWGRVFDSNSFRRLQEVRSLTRQQFAFPAQTWASILFDAAVAYKNMPPDGRITLVDSLHPLYLGKVLAYVRRTERLSLQQAEEHVENECAVFEETKPYLVGKW